MLNRIMLITAVVISAISAAAALFGKGVFIHILAVLATLFILCLIFRRFHIARSFIIVLPISMLFLIPESTVLSKIETAQSLIGKSETVYGYVCEEPEHSGNYTKYTIKTTSIGNSDLPQNLKLFIVDFTGASLEIFDNFKADITFERHEDKYKLTNYADGIYISAKAENISKLNTKHSTPYSLAVNLRKKIRNSVYNSLPAEEASVICGIMLGDRNGIDNKLYNDFKSCGIVHIVCVSGLHLSVICYSLLRFLKALKISQKAACLLTSGAVFIVMAVTGFSPSVMRASAMFLLMLIGRIIHKRSDALNLLGCSVVINCFINPFIVFFVGFQLSVLSTMGIIIIVPWVERRLHSIFKSSNIFSRLGRYVIISISQCLAATIFTLPAICASVKYISVVAPVVSILLIYPATLILILSVIAALFCLISFSFLANPLFLASGLLAKFFIFIVRLFASFPITTIGISGEETLFCIIACGIAAAICIILYPNRRTVKISICLVSLIAIANIFINTLLETDQIKVNILSLESGRPAVLISQNGASVAICSNMSSDELIAFSNMISSYSSTIDMLIINDKANDMRTEAIELCSRFKVYAIVSDNTALTEAYKSSQNSIKTYELDNSTIKLWNDIEIEFVSDKNSSAFYISSSKASLSLICPANQNYGLWEKAINSDVVVLSAPYPNIYPEDQAIKSTILLSSSRIDENTYKYFNGKNNVTAVSAGDIISFSLSNTPALN